jgi:hypothetical protein
MSGTSTWNLSYASFPDNKLILYLALPYRDQRAGNKNDKPHYHCTLPTLPNKYEKLKNTKPKQDSKFLEQYCCHDFCVHTSGTYFKGTDCLCL